MNLTKKPKLAFFDIDGTLVGKSGLLSIRTKNALSALRAKGVLLALATGRPLFGAKTIADQLGINCISLFSSGALIANPESDSTFFEASIDILQLQECINLGEKLGLYVELYSRDNYFIEKVTSITAKHTEYLGKEPDVLEFSEVLKSSAINKVVTISDNPQLHAAQDILTKEMRNLVCLCSKGASHPEILFNNITSRAASRADGFKRITQALAIQAEEVIAFGDASSDLTFLELAGTGVAMKDASDEVKEKADLVADSADNDGVAEVVERIIAEMG